MALDVNKIIMESIQDNLEGSSTDADNASVLAEGASVDAGTSPEDASQPEEGYNPIAAAVPPAISAGLGALTLRNKIRAVKQ